MKSRDQHLIESGIMKIMRRVISENADQYVVQYMTGGWSNWKVVTLPRRFSKEAAIAEVSDIMRMGYYAVKIKASQFKSIGGLAYSTDFETDAERKRYWDKIMAGKP